MKRIANLQAIAGTTAQASSEVYEFVRPNVVCQADGAVSASTGAATILFEGHCGGGVWHTIATISLTLGVTATTAVASTLVPYRYIRARVTAISGTNATVNVWFSSEI
jgi:hypothetical protein